MKIYCLWKTDVEFMKIEHKLTFWPFSQPRDYIRNFFHQINLFAISLLETSSGLFILTAIDAFLYSLDRFSDGEWLK